MLDSINGTAEPEPNVHKKWSRCHETVTGRSIAKAERNPYERAQLAASWVLGSLTIEPPTVTLAARVFGVSQPLVYEEVRFLKANTVAAPPIDHVWGTMTEAERDAFVRDHFPDIWTRIDRLTA